MNNKSRFFYIIPVLTGVAIAVAGPSAGYGQAAPQSSSVAAASPAPGEEAVVNLPEFNVTGVPVDPYNSSEAVSAARTSSKILDTPMTAYVITPALIQDINPNTLFDVTTLFCRGQRWPRHGPGRLQRPPDLPGFRELQQDRG